MLTRLIYNKKAFKILNNYQIKSSNSEVTFNDIVIDFTGYSLMDIPFKYQEIQIRTAEKEEDIFKGDVIFTGFLDEIDLSEMKMKKEQRELTLTLLSPLAMATKRTVSLIGTFAKEQAIKRVLQPLIDDGFIIAEMNISKGQIITNFILETVENCMNNICFKLNIFWYIDENKNIYINSIDYLFELGAKRVITRDKKEEHLLKIQPKIENVDYANVINFKNVRLYYHAKTSINNTFDNTDYPILNLPKTVKKGDTVQFNYPIVVDEKNLRMLIEDEEINEDIFDIKSFYLETKTKNYFCGIKNDENSSNYNNFVVDKNISFNDEGKEEKEIVLQRDSFFSNLITGFKYNGESNLEIESIESMSALRYTTLRFMYSNEINNLKGVISNSGIIEKTVDYQEKWTTSSQLIEYARSLMISNTKTINQVELEYDINPNLKIGDLVEIKEPDFYIEGKFVVKEINYTFTNELEQNWNIILKNSDLNSTYIDLFRPAEVQENENKIDTVVLSEFIEENMYESHSVEVKDENTK